MLRFFLKPIKLMYRGLRPLGLVDVTHLMHLPTDESRLHSGSCQYEIRELSPEQLRAHRDEGTAPHQIGAYDDPEVRSLLVAQDGDQIVAFLWLVRHRVEAKDNYARTSHLGTPIEMPAGTAFIYNAWTDRRYRGNRLAGMLAAYAVRHRVLSAWALLTSIDWTNQSSIRAFERLGMRSLGIVIRFGVGPFQLTATPRLAHRLGLRVAEQVPGQKIAF